MIAVAQPGRRDWLRVGVADSCYAALALTGWVAVSAACVVALLVGFFVFLGEFDFGRMVLHIENFASRYVAADAVRQAEFRRLFWIAFAVLFSFVAFFRRHSFPAILVKGKES